MIFFFINWAMQSNLQLSQKSMIKEMGGYCFVVAGTVSMWGIVWLQQRVCVCRSWGGGGGGFVCRDLCMCMLVMWNHDDVMHRNVDIAMWTMVVYNRNCIRAVPFCPPIRCRTVWREAGPVPVLHGRGAVLLHVSEVQRTVWRLHWWGWWIRM